MYEKFVALLKMRHINTNTVSKATGVSSATFTEWKQGKYNPKLDKLQKIADYFNVPVSYFLDDTATLESSLPINEVNRLKTVSASLDATTKEILNNLNRLSAEQKNAILALIKSFAK